MPPDEAELRLKLRSRASEIVLTAALSAATKLSPSQLDVSGQPSPSDFVVRLRGSQDMGAKDATRKLIVMFQDPQSVLYASAALRMVFSGAELEVIRCSTASRLPPPAPAQPPRPLVIDSGNLKMYSLDMVTVAMPQHRKLLLHLARVHPMTVINGEEIVAKPSVLPRTDLSPGKSRSSLLKHQHSPTPQKALASRPLERFGVAADHHHDKHTGEEHVVRTKEVVMKETESKSDLSPQLPLLSPDAVQHQPQAAFEVVQDAPAVKAEARKVSRPLKASLSRRVVTPKRVETDSESDVATAPPPPVLLPPPAPQPVKPPASEDRQIVMETESESDRPVENVNRSSVFSAPSLSLPVGRSVKLSVSSAKAEADDAADVFPSPDRQRGSSLNLGWLVGESSASEAVTPAPAPSFEPIGQSALRSQGSAGKFPVVAEAVLRASSASSLRKPESSGTSLKWGWLLGESSGAESDLA